MNIRKSVFILLDKIRGGAIIKDLFDISHRIENNEGNPDALNALLVHSTETVDAYKTYKGETDLSKFPIVNKNILGGGETLTYISPINMTVRNL